MLTLQYDKVIYLLKDSRAMRRLIGRYIDVYEYPNGRIELWAHSDALPYVTYDRLPEIDQGVIVENKRLGHVLEVAQAMQAQRDSRHGCSMPSRANRGCGPIQLKVAEGKKAQRRIDEADLAEAIAKVIH